MPEDRYTERPRRSGPPPTPEIYDTLQRAYEYFNARLFDNRLPDCVITLRRHGRCFGYFAGDRFGADLGELCDEIALNPRHFQDRSLAATLATLVHEMVHLWQHHYGKPGRGSYHNRQWADRMKALGLQPSHTGEPGGKETGDTMSHYILPGGAFENAMRQLEQRRFALRWSERPVAAEAKTPKAPGGAEEEDGDKSGARQKFTCPSCSLNAWAKHSARLLCGEHKIPMVAA
ncbi:MAG: SprT-like domain-containing protein [Alphaproteobacteria bacterium]|nr:SprT-like domain-containing protein [Alphaproteobacteria bacterium]